MPELPKLIRVERIGGSFFKLEINGEDFPHALIADAPITATMVQDSLASLNLTLMAERVEFIDDPFGKGVPISD
ncbi:hypothetical protein [Streptosporangium jomthongense]|uniref:Uncharacterized protein n=1 Tax=Streptosporangium jomthongense TaxID=1193683 RepID=A0ABV8FEU7_9ACTN